MARGKVLSRDASGGGTIRQKTRQLTFTAGDLTAGFNPAAGDLVSFDRDGTHARSVRPPDPEAPGPSPSPGSTSPPPARMAGPQRPPQPARRQAAPRPATRPPATAPGPQPRARRPSPPPDAANAFINPYNFVPLHRDGAHRDDTHRYARLGLGGRTVRFTVELVFGTLACVSPVKRPGPPHPDGVPQWWVRRDPQGRPWIPGSSLKGPIRSVLEALSRSCMSEFDHEAVFSWRPIAPASAGFLIREARGWVIQPADDIRALPRRQPPVSSSERWEGMAVDKGRGSLRLLYASDQPGARAYTGEWVITDVSEDSTKRWQRIFSVSGKAKLPVPDGVVHAADKAHAGQYEADDERLKQERPIRVRLGQITSTRDPRCPYKRMEVGERRPVWYRLGRHGRVSELGPVALFRRTFNDSDEKPLTLGMLLRRSELGGSGSYRRCEDPGLLCPACALFGTTTPAGEASGWQGRVRISPAWSDAPLDDDEPVVLRPAGKPHPSAQTFYLWDPDHPDDPTAAAFGNDNAVLRGRKFYWHRRDTTKDHVRVPDAQYRELKERGVLAKQLQAKELIPAGTRFTFEVDADGLSEVELGLLVLAIDPARLARLLGSPRKPLHKLGGGKPLGMGSARLTITTAVELRPEHRYTTRLLDGTDTVTHTGAELEETLDRWARAAIFQHRLTTQRDDVRALLAILDWNAVPDPELLSYPPGRDKPYESFQWFMEYAFKDRKTGRPIASREHRGPDPLRTVEEVAEHRRYQWRWPTTRPRT